MERKNSRLVYIRQHCVRKTVNHKAENDQKTKTNVTIANHREQ